jgi:thymidylate synthase (FAD)
MEARLIDMMGDEASIVQAARVSYGQGTKTPSEDRGLIRYLMRHWHTTPFEMVELKFRIKCPIFVARQHLRHRTASVNEISGRYTEVKEEFWIPREFRTQGTTNHQGSGAEFENAGLKTLYISACQNAFETYRVMLRGGVAREIARAVLPQSTMTEFYWKINLHNLLHYLRLRLSPDAQSEIRELAEQMLAVVRERLPIVAQAFDDFRRNAVTFTGPELARAALSVGEQREFDAKKNHVQSLNGSSLIETRADD